MIKCGRCGDRHATANEVRSCYGVSRAESSSTGRGSSTDTTTPVRPSTGVAHERVVPNGTYTVVFDNVGQNYITLRLRDDFRPGARPDGTQVVEYLAGPDNELDFRGCAFLEGAELRMWKRFRGPSSNGLAARVEEAVDCLLEGEGARDTGREIYALRSGRCARCGHKLTVPASLHRGLGPVCAEQVGAR